MESTRDIFSHCHPTVVLAYFAGIIGVTMLVMSPVFAGLSLVGATMACLAVRGRSALPLIGGIAVLGAGVTLLNPLFNTAGDTVLFEVFGRPYTAEVLMFGGTMGGALGAALLWFSVASRALTAEKVTYLFGGRAPALTTVLTLVLRLVPAYGRRATALAEARAGVGLGVSEADGLGGKVRVGATLLSSLTAWSLEQGVTTADSLAARGFGSGSRTAWGRYRFRWREGALMALLGVLAFGMGAGVAAGAGAAEFLPRFQLPAADALVLVGWVSWTAMVLLPTMLAVAGEVRWRCSLWNI
ncbi:energy-coupling factor transporter transmembrane component T [Adlercreutzia sp. R7]|uniref:Energy-coupling factor transporter transmembrane component T n=1 Tax=Adlercreutzia wanghongyangiae TaxID=3111451 RepID=A0ABU6IG56_9ACTN|nr:energy-coupling factor transporter transmembrane component T [Adlercreutzia sp. R7]